MKKIVIIFSFIFLLIISVSCSMDTEQIKLLGDEYVTLKVGDTYKDEGIYGPTDCSYTILGSITPTVAGCYPLTYEVKNRHGEVVKELKRYVFYLDDVDSLVKTWLEKEQIRFGLTTYKQFSPTTYLEYMEQSDTLMYRVDILDRFEKKVKSYRIFAKNGDLTETTISVILSGHFEPGKGTGTITFDASQLLTSLSFEAFDEGADLGQEELDSVNEIAYDLYFNLYNYSRYEWRKLTGLF